MKKTTKILLGILIATGILHLSLMYIPQLFRTDHLVHYAQITPIETKDNDTIPTTKTINAPFKHIVFSNGCSNNTYGSISIYCKKADEKKQPSITLLNSIADVCTYKTANDTLYIYMSESPYYPYNNNIKIEVFDELKSVSNASAYDIDVHNLHGLSFDIIAPKYITTANNEIKPNLNPSIFTIGFYNCKIRQLSNNSDAGIDVVESYIENLHQSRRSWSIKQKDFPCNED